MKLVTYNIQYGIGLDGRSISRALPMRCAAPT